MNSYDIVPCCPKNQYFESIFLEPKCYWNQHTKFEIDSKILACLLWTDQPLLTEKLCFKKVSNVVFL